MPVPPFPPPPATSDAADEWRPATAQREPQGESGGSQPPIVPAPALPAWPAPGNLTVPEPSAHTAPPGYTLPARSSRTFPGLPEATFSAPPEESLPAPRLSAPEPPPAARPAEPDPSPMVDAHPVASAPPVPRQRAGTVYGGPTGHLTVALPTGNPVENSGSLTGHILAQGWTDGPAAKSHTTRVVTVLAIGLGLLVALGLLMVVAARDVLGLLFDGLLIG